jgi:hypothetical protein
MMKNRSKGESVNGKGRVKEGNKEGEYGLFTFYQE